MSMFEQASRLKVRFDTPKGQLAVEDLWELPLTSTVGKTNLDAIAVDLHNKLSQSNLSFVNTKTTETNLNQLKFDIVKRVIEVRIEENNKAQTARANAEKKQMILAALAQREQQDLLSMPTEDLRKLVETL